MREIKFRAWNSLARFMTQVLGVGDFEPEDVEDISRGTLILMQFTGLKDKNGKEIYEGDIVKVSAWGWCGEFDVLWCNGGFKLMERKSVISGASDGWMNSLFKTCRCGTDSNDNLEVIGNIYENPELLENKHE